MSSAQRASVLGSLTSVKAAAATPTPEPTTTQKPPLFGREGGASKHIEQELASGPPRGDNAPAVSVGYAAYVPGQTYPVGTRLELPVDLVAPHPRNPRVHFREAELSTLQLSISAVGQQEDVKVFWNPESNSFMLKSGHRRHLALKRLARPLIKAELVARIEDPVVEYKEARELNTEHSQQNHFDDAVRFQEMMEISGLGQNELAEQLGMSRSAFSKILKLGKLHRPLIDRMAEDPNRFGVEVAYLLALVYERTGADERAQAEVERLIKKRVEGKLTLAQLQALAPKAGRAAGPVVQAAPTAKRHHPLMRAELSGVAPGEVKAYGDRWELLMKMPSGQKRDTLIQKVLELFEEHGVSSQAAGLPAQQ